MRNFARMLTACTAALLFTSSTALAANPHFVSVSATEEADFDLRVRFKEAGLGANETVTIEVAALFSATFECFNKSGKVPNDPKKTNIVTDVSETDDFTSGKNGSVTATITLSPLDASDVGFSCPPGQQAVRSNVSWSDVTITDKTNDVSVTVPL